MTRGERLSARNSLLHKRKAALAGRTGFARMRMRARQGIYVDRAGRKDKEDFRVLAPTLPIKYTVRLIPRVPFQRSRTGEEGVDGVSI
jgi:hypothetical protein